MLKFISKTFVYYHFKAFSTRTERELIGKGKETLALMLQNGGNNFWRETTAGEEMSIRNCKNFPIIYKITDLLLTEGN